jgi:hypothetical protein
VSTNAFQRTPRGGGFNLLKIGVFTGLGAVVGAIGWSIASKPTAPVTAQPVTAARLVEQPLTSYEALAVPENAPLSKVTNRPLPESQTPPPRPAGPPRKSLQELAVDAGYGDSDRPQGAQAIQVAQANGDPRSASYRKTPRSRPSLPSGGPTVSRKERG